MRMTKTKHGLSPSSTDQPLPDAKKQKSTDEEAEAVEEEPTEEVEKDKEDRTTREILNDDEKLANVTPSFEGDRGSFICIDSVSKGRMDILTGKGKTSIPARRLSMTSSMELTGRGTRSGSGSRTKK